MRSLRSICKETYRYIEHRIPVCRGEKAISRMQKRSHGCICFDLLVSSRVRNLMINMINMINDQHRKEAGRERRIRAKTERDEEKRGSSCKLRMVHAPAWRTVTGVPLGELCG